MCQKLVPDPYLILVNKPTQSLHARNYFKSRDILKEDYQKALKNLTLFFLLNPVSFNGKSYQKLKEPGTSNQSALPVTKQIQKNSFISYTLSDQV